MQTAFQRSARMACQEHPDTFVVMQIRVTHWRTVQNQRVIQQRLAVGVLCLFQLFEERYYKTDVIFVDQCELRNQLFVFSIMRSTLVSIILSTLRTCTA